MVSTVDGVVYDLSEREQCDAASLIVVAQMPMQLMVMILVMALMTMSLSRLCVSTEALQLFHVLFLFSAYSNQISIVFFLRTKKSKNRSKFRNYNRTNWVH